MFRCPAKDHWLSHPSSAWELPAPLFRSGPDGAKSLGVKVRAVLGCSDDVVAVLTPASVELRDRAEPTRIVSQFPALETRGAAFAAGHVLLYREGVLELFDGNGRSERRIQTGEVTGFALDVSGAVLFASENTLALWRDGAPRKLEISTPVRLGRRAPRKLEAPGFTVRTISAEHGRFLVRGTATRWADSVDAVLLVDREGKVARMVNAGSPPQMASGRLATTSANGTITITDLTDGTTLRLVMPGFQDDIVLTAHTLVAVSRSHGLVRIVPLDDVPRDPAALRAYVLAASNARVEPGATFASFPPAN